MTEPHDSRLKAARQLYARVVAAKAGAMQSWLAAALVVVPREAFLGPAPWYVTIYEGDGRAAGQRAHVPVTDPIHVYQDLLFALDRDKGINNGEPYLHGSLLGALAPPLGGRVLHIGCGVGYYTALLAELVGPTGRVVAYEVEPRLVDMARAALRAWSNVTVNAASGTDSGPLPMADGIYVSAGATRPHALWLEALADGGRLVFPLSSAGSFGRGVSLLIERRGSDFVARVLGPSGFIGCAGANEAAEGERVTQAYMTGALFRAQRLVRDGAPDATAVLTGAGWWLSSKPLAS